MNQLVSEVEELIKKKKKRISARQLYFAVFSILIYIVLTWLTPILIYRFSIYPDKIIDEKKVAFIKMLTYPIGDLFSDKFLDSNTWYLIIAGVYYFFLVIAISKFYSFLKKRKLLVKSSLLLFFCWAFLRVFPNTLLIFNNDETSISHGTSLNGWLENGKRLPFKGANYQYFNFWSYLKGFCFVNGKVEQTIIDAYKLCEQTCPETTFIMMEGSKSNGGTYVFNHATHRNGLSMDFMTPLKKENKPYILTNILNAYGYGLNFNDQGKLTSSMPINLIPSNVHIDFETMARHILALDKAAKNNGTAINLILFKKSLVPLLLATPSGKKVKARKIPFYEHMDKFLDQAHDDHYHVEFAP